MLVEHYPTPPPTLPEFWEAIAVHRHVEITPASHTLTRGLSPVERATVSVKIERSNLDFFAEPSILGEALLRLAIMDHRGQLRCASGHQLARTLQRTLGKNSHPVALRRAHEGWALLHALDKADIGAACTLSAEPLPNSQARRRIRLHARVSELCGEHR